MIYECRIMNKSGQISSLKIDKNHKSYLYDEVATFVLMTFELCSSAPICSSWYGSKTREISDRFPTDFFQKIDKSKFMANFTLMSNYSRCTSKG